MANRRQPQQLVSVIVTAHNDERHLDACLTSILASTHREIEVVVLDDGSTDATPQIIDRFAAADSRIRAGSSSHRGRRRSLEAAHATASGSVHCWVDADDMVDRRGIEYALRRLDDDHELVYTYRDLIDDRGMSLGPHLKNKVPYRPGQLLVDNMIFHLRLFTAELLEKSGGVGDLEAAIDWDMNLRMVEWTTPVCVPQSLYHYRVHRGRMSTTPLQAACGEVAVNRAIQRRGLDMELTVSDAGWHLTQRSSD
jgi:glycosyltransferase involved in cell wall biosynthesis